MSTNLFLDILDEARKDLLPSFVGFKGTYYLAGGTGLALQIGHRDSIDFDFFRNDSFDPSELNKELRSILKDKRITVIQEEKDTLTVLANDTIKLSYFTYPYQLISPLVSSEYLDLASIEDIGCMKLSAIMSRSLLKDYVDLYFILQRIPLGELLAFAKQKFPNWDGTVALKSLTYFEDITQEPILYKHEHQISFEAIQKFLESQVKMVIDEAVG